MNKFARFSRPLLGLGALVGLSQAHAAIDIAAATAGITDASTAVLAVMGALITMAAVIFGVTKVYHLLKKGG